MDAQQRGAVSDDALDAELRALLAVDPSPEFTARVRQRIDREPARAAAWWPWTLGAAAVVAAAVALMVAPRREPRAVASPVVLTSRAVSPTGPLAVGVHGFMRATHDAHAVRAVVADVRALEPEVLVDPREAAAIRAFIMAVDAGAIDTRPIARAPQPPPLDTLPDTTPLDIAFITIESLAPVAPLTPDGAPQGVHQ